MIFMRFPFHMEILQNQIKKKTSHANIMQMCSHDIRLKIARFSCDLFYARFYAIRYLCQIHKIYAKFT